MQCKGRADVEGLRAGRGTYRDTGVGLLFLPGRGEYAADAAAELGRCCSCKHACTQEKESKNTHALNVTRPPPLGKRLVLPAENCWAAAGAIRACRGGEHMVECGA